MDTKKYIEALDMVLRKRYESREYSLNGYKEEAVCLAYNNGWIVFNGERGNHYDEVKCDTILKACMEFIRKMTHKTEDISIMENEFLVFFAKAA